MLPNYITGNSEIQIEYQNIFNKIPENEKESFTHSLKLIDTEVHAYLRIIQAIDKTLLVYSNPSPNWFFIYARMSFIAAKYDNLMEFWNMPKYKDEVQLLPFVARILTYQNQFEKAIELCNSAIDSILFETDDLQLVDILTYFEAQFTLGIAQGYTRQIELLSSTVDVLKSKSRTYKIKKIVTEEYFLDLLFYENILKVIGAFMSGKPKDMELEMTSMESWVSNMKDPWLKGYYYNLRGISQLQAQKMQEAEQSFKDAYHYFDVVHDLRGFATVGANLGTSLLSKGQRDEGRKYIESVLEAMVSLKNYRLAISNMVQVSKSYLDEKKIVEANRLITWAEELSAKTNIIEPATFSYLCYFYSKIGKLQKANENLSKLHVLINEVNEDNTSKTDIYSMLWYHNAASVHLMTIGDLNQATKNILFGIEIADNNGHYDFSLDLSTIHLEILLKRYIIEQNDKYLIDAIALIDDLTPLITKMDNAYYETIFLILKSYLYLANNNKLEARSLFDIAKEKSHDYQDSEQYEELNLFKRRFDFLNEDRADKNSDEILQDWLSDEYLPIIYSLEAKRLLSNLQFQSTNLGTQPPEKEIYPVMLLILSRAGITVYSHTFKKHESEMDEALIGGFLGAITSFSQELFGGGMLSRIDQENHVLLIEKISEHNLMILIVDDETYSIRKKFKRFSRELSKMKVVDYLDSGIYLTKHDPQWQIIEGLIEIIFKTEIIDE